MGQPWVTEGDVIRCRTHDLTFPVGRACPTCATAPVVLEQTGPDPNEAKHAQRVATTADRLHDQAKDAKTIVEMLFMSIRDLNTDMGTAREGPRIMALSTALASATRAWAMASDVERKALVAAADYDKVLARVAKVANQRRERTAMRKARGH